MIRRLHTMRRLRAVVTVVAVAVTASGCSTFTDNDVAATANGRELSIDDFNTIVADFPKLTPDATGADEFGEYSGDSLRDVLTRWVQATSLVTEVDGRGIVIDDATRDAAAAQYQASDTATWTSLAPETQRFLVDYTVGRTALLKDEAFIPASTVESIYNSGVNVSGVLCIRIMAFDSEAEAAAARAQVQGGASFADIADEHPIDPTAAPNGGVFLDQQSGGPCLAAGNYALLAQSVADAPVGEPGAPVPLDNFFFLIIQRPYAEVAAEARTLIAPTIAQPLLAEVFSAADVTVDSRYGMWDAESGTIVPTR